MWDWAAGKEVRVAARTPDRTDAVTYSPDGKHVITAGPDAAFRVWAANTGALVRTGAVDYPSHLTKGPVHFAAGGRVVVLGCVMLDRAFLFDPATGEELHPGPVARIVSAL